MKIDDVLARLKEHVAAEATAKAFAAKIGLSPQYVSDVLAGRRPPAQRLLDAIGLKEVVIYELKRRGK